MASHNYQPAQLPGPRHGPPAGYAPHVMSSHGPPAGTFAPGTKIQVGSHRVVIQKYLSEGGFAHVYLVKLSSPIDGKDSAVLKRVAVPDKDSLRGMRTEVETMKRLKGHRPIVTYIDSHASELKHGGYEVFLLMEFCDGGGLIDFMNTRLQHRLTEPEILDIFADVAEGVACMHYLKPPLLHRDLKVENVLIVKSGSSKRFKVCDFGSTAPPRPAPTTVVECRLMDEDIQKHTTLQYRAPEMVDVYRKQPLNEKSDIWALGVFLYKLCYYTTPFEDQGQLAILNASFKYPHHPVFSDRLKKLIGSMLRENMQSRPNIYQVLQEACAMQGREVPIPDIYSGQAQREAYSTSKYPPANTPQATSGVVVGAVYSPPSDDKPNLPDIVPMRRGRPSISPGPSQKSGSTARKVTDGDPFAALDSTDIHKMAGADEISSRFPTLDQFALLHDKGTKFDFETSAPSPIGEAHQVQQAPSTPMETPLSKVSSSAPTQTERVQSSRASDIIRSNPDLEAISNLSQTGSKYVSTGTMTSEFSSRTPTPQADMRYAQTKSPKPNAGSDILPIHARPPHLRRPSLSSRPSSEDNRRNAQAGTFTTATATSTTTSSSNTSSTRPRPASTSFESSTLEFLREKELEKPQKSSTNLLSQTSISPEAASAPLRLASSPLPKHMDDDLLLDMDESSSSVGLKSSHTDKRTSGSASPVPRNPAHKLSSAINRFEGGGSSHEVVVTNDGPSPKSNILVDIDDDDMTPEMRREVEREKLEEEEKRVAAAQAEYRQRIASSGNKPPTPGPKNALVGGPLRTASTIQSRMQSLLNEDQKRPAAVQRTAQGYGKYTDDPASASSPSAALPGPARKAAEPKPAVTPVTISRTNSTRTPTPTVLPSHLAPTSSVKPPGSKQPPAPKKKPTHLNSLPAAGRPSTHTKPTPSAQADQLLPMNLPPQFNLEMSAQEKADYIADFTKRFPSLSALEMEARMKGLEE
ncbi:hypothetical protein E4U43_006858 [Claviceps pusilla]|uniref:non-specific serine/threonine protein kinase n=1 Tax=Claviceps pusilla TaxID=123648 RepID=A0A9P7SYH2_9HYPO|nr:hypothetical protein E4U43_006858 [Claviceps pusilla]